MDYLLIKGYFHIVGHSPDGDSLKFEAANPALWEKINTEYREAFEENLKAENGIVQLRLQGIDALETHYSPGPVPTPAKLKTKTHAGAEKPTPGKFHQPSELAFAATERMLKLLGVTKVHWNSWRTAVQKIEVKTGSQVNTISKKGEDRLPGYIITNDIERKGRPISWAFAGAPKSADGEVFQVGELADALKNSFNYRLLSYGLVYPYFFMTLSARLRQKLITGMRSAVRKKQHIWGADQTQTGISITNLSELKQDHLVLPYLFRRLVNHQYRYQMADYYEAVESKKTFKPSDARLYLEQFFEDTNPYIFLIKEKDFVRLSDVIQIEKDKFQLKTDPGNIVFLS